MRAGARSAGSGVRGTRPRPGSQPLRHEEPGAQGEESELCQEELVGVELSLEKGRNGVRMEEVCLRIEFLKGESKEGAR